MSEIVGQVAAVMDRDFHGTKLYSFHMEGSQRFFKMGKKKPNFEAGQWIKFTERNANVEWDTIQVSDAPWSPATTRESPSIPGTPALGADNAFVEQHRPVMMSQPTANVGRRIQVQAARADAARVVVAALHVDALPWASNVAKAKKLDLLVGYIDQVTKQLLKLEDETNE